MRAALLGLMLFALVPVEARADGRAQALLQQSRSAYAALKSYRDQGTVRYDVLGSTQEVRFETVFVRPDRFRFEWSKGHPFPPLRSMTTRTAIWFDGEAAFWWQRDSFKRETQSRMESLSRAVAGATGVSSGAAHTIATLLLPDLWGADKFGDSLLNLRDAKHVGEGVVDAVPCERVAGVDWRDEPVELWIGRHDRVIRRVQSEVKGTRYVEERRNVVIDGPVADSEFAAPGNPISAR